MRERQIFAVGPIMHHEEPPADLLLSCVQGVTRDCLLNLSQQRLGIADKKIANVRAALEFQSQHFDRDTKQAARSCTRHRLKDVLLYMAAKRPNAPSRPMFAVSIAIPFFRTVNNERTAPSGK